MSHEESPVVYLLTPAGRGAIATLRVEGEGAAALVGKCSVLAAGRELTRLADGAIAVARWAHETGEEVVLRAAEGAVEIHCHGGAEAAQAIVDDLAARGCRVSDPHAWVERDERDPIRAAALGQLTRALTVRTAGVLLDQYRGALRTSVERVMSAAAADRPADAAGELDQLLSRAPLGLHLVEPWNIVLVGRANAGKSSLINALLGYERTLVDAAPGTTRDAVGDRSALDGWPVVLFDTAGVRDTRNELEKAGMERMASRATGADLLVQVYDASEPWPAEPLPRAAAAAELTVHTKCDLTGGSTPTGRPAGIATSAVTGLGIDLLRRKIGETLVGEAPVVGAAVPFTPEQVERLERAAEALRGGDVNRALDALTHGPLAAATHRHVS